MSLISHALAEMTELDATLEGLTTGEAAAGGAIVGIAIGLFIAVAIVWYAFQVIADWKIFEKAGDAGWKSLIPVYNIIVEYSHCWKGVMGAFFAVCALAANILVPDQNVETWRLIVGLALLLVTLVLHIIQSLKLAKAFGKGTGFGVCLILFGPIARLILGFGGDRYVGHPD